MTKTNDQLLLDPCIEYLLICEYDRECIHLRIALECLPVDLSIDEAFDCVLRSVRERVIELVEYSFCQNIESL
jgi:hypothetical protein